MTGSAGPERRAAALAGVVGPSLFVGGWLLAASRRPGYSSVHDAISQLARLGTPDRWLMTTAFVGFGIATLLFVGTLSAHLGGSRLLRAAVSLAAIATLGVAAVPLSRSGGGLEDVGHTAFATAGYLGTASSALLGGVLLFRQGRRRVGLASLFLGSVSVLSLVATEFAHDVGLCQRVGLTAVDFWLAAMALSVLLGARGRTASRVRAVSSPAPALPGG